MEKLNKQMTDTINKCCGLNITATLATGFEMSQNNQSIYYSITVDKCDKDFCNFVNKTWNCNFKPQSVELMELSILHEVGHFKTFPYFSNNNFAWNQLCKLFINKMPKCLSRLQNYLYFHLPLEKTATAWAVNYLRKCPKKAKVLEKEMVASVTDFYKRAGIG